MRNIGNRLRVIWCGMMHDAPMWPIHGQYQCGTCGQHYPVQWATEPQPSVRHAYSSSVHSAAVQD